MYKSNPDGLAFVSWREIVGIEYAACNSQVGWIWSDLVGFGRTSLGQWVFFKLLVVRIFRRQERVFTLPPTPGWKRPLPVGFWPAPAPRPAAGQLRAGGTSSPPTPLPGRPLRPPSAQASISEEITPSRNEGKQKIIEKSDGTTNHRSRGQPIPGSFPLHLCSGQPMR